MDDDLESLMDDLDGAQRRVTVASELHSIQLRGWAAAMWAYYEHLTASGFDKPDAWQLMYDYHTLFIQAWFDDRPAQDAERMPPPPTAGEWP